MLATNWGELCKRYIFDDVDGKPIPAADYHRQKNFESLGVGEKQILRWLQKRKQRFVNLRQLTKCLTMLPCHDAETIRQSMKKLEEAGFVMVASKPIFYCGFWRKEGWEVIKRQN